MGNWLLNCNYLISARGVLGTIKSEQVEQMLTGFFQRSTKEVTFAPTGVGESKETPNLDKKRRDAVGQWSQ